MINNKFSCLKLKRTGQPEEIPHITSIIPVLFQYAETVCDSPAGVLEKNEFIKRRISIGKIEEDTGMAVCAYIRLFNDIDNEAELPAESRQPIEIHIDSIGGALESAMSIVDSIKKSITPVYTYNDGKAYSAGLLILLSGHKRFSKVHSSFLYHEGSTSVLDIDASKFHQYSDFYKNLLEKVKEIIYTNTKLDRKEINDHSKDDWWFFTEEAKKMGFIDEVI